MPGPQRTVTRDDVFALMQNRPSASDPWTVEELAERIGCSESTVYNRLRELHSLDQIQTRKNGQNRYWWPVTDDTMEVHA